jgi:protein MpaA
VAVAGHRVLGFVAAIAIAAPAAAVPAQVIGRSVQGRPILAYRLGDPAATSRVLVVGCIHGDECAAFPVVARLVRQRPPRGVQLWVVPSVNPDGRRAGSRGNAHGVDLNRNFPLRWRPIARPSRYHSGPRPLSEPESRAVAGLIRTIRPDLSIWFHQPERNVRDPDASLAARRYARLVGLPFLPLAAPPGTVSEWTEWRVPGAEAFVVELPAGLMSPAAGARHVAAIWAVATPGGASARSGGGSTASGGGAG